MAKNKRRGEVTFSPIPGVEYTMCMTLGAMAEIEEAFELDSITELSEVFSDGKFKIRQLIQLLAALIRGGGHDIEDSEIENFDLNAVEAFSLAMEAINVQGEEKKKLAKKKKPAKK